METMLVTSNGRSAKAEGRRREGAKARRREGAKARRHEGTKASQNLFFNTENTEKPQPPFVPPKGEKTQRNSVTQLFSYSLLRSYALRVLCLSVLCLSVYFSAAQSSVSFGYDDSGNRISRTIIYKALTPPPQDSIETIIEEESVIASLQEIEMPQEVYTDVLSEALIKIYPNPTTGLLTVKFTNKPQDAASSVTLFDIQGRIVTQQQSLSDENTLHIGAQPAGTYLMRIVIGEEVVSWKIVKQ